MPGSILERIAEYGRQLSAQPTEEQLRRQQAELAYSFSKERRTTTNWPGNEESDKLLVEQTVYAINWVDSVIKDLPFSVPYNDRVERLAEKIYEKRTEEGLSDEPLRNLIHAQRLMFMYRAPGLVLNSLLLEIPF